MACFFYLYFVPTAEKREKDQAFHKFHDFYDKFKQDFFYPMKKQNISN